jgi:hypothetical protein
MEYVFKAHGHSNVTSLHKTTFEVTTDPEIGKTADCVIGVSSDAVLDNMPLEMKKSLKNENTIVRIVLETKNAKDEIYGCGDPDLSLSHPSDMVCRKSTYTCSRTLMIKADKAACDLKEELVDDLKDGKALKCKIIIIE